MTHTLLSLGSNTGNSRLNLEIAMVHLAAMPARMNRSDGEKSEVLRKSSVHITPPWGKTDQPDFLNIAVVLITGLTVVQLMQNILSIEKLMGRERTEKWGPRLIDIDIILFGDEIVNSPEVNVPHPHMRERRFVLAPSAEIAGEMIDPLTSKSIMELLKECPEPVDAIPGK